MLARIQELMRLSRKSILHMVLSNESSRSQYDQDTRHQDNIDRPSGGDWEYNFEYYNGIRTYRWADLRRKMQREIYWERIHTSDNFSSYYDKDDESDEETPDEEEFHSRKC